MDIQRIQELLNNTAALEKTMTLRQIANRIEASTRKDDEAFKQKMKEINKNRSAEWKENLKNNRYKIYESDGYKNSIIQTAKERSVPVITPYGEFASQAEFRRVTGQLFSNKSKVYPHLYYNKDKGIEKTTYQKVYYSPYGYHYKKIEVLRMAKNAGEFLEIDETRATDWFNQQKRISPDQYYIKKEPKREWALENKDEQE